ncbi:MAG: hypothetical protein EO766_11820 [Hydrotalea sp. AMD]|uniref:hypothetical protein n=1 Tax=Hydrotalea sp. AMD TaxID=2501297 RepID=UPI001026AF52|nr:hypothetical protein [Hydrotalea sp. AMD]RWZ87211.1 MAG: hypothetical protein EO766_11820 [Hydrotalea sp. AMD]
MKVNELLNEGPLDYFRGAGQELGNKIRNISQPFKDIHRAGQVSSMESDITKSVVRLAKTIQKYREVKKQLTPVQEGVFDYLRGAKQETGKKMQQAFQPFKDIHQAGKQESLRSSLSQLEQSSKQQLNELVRLLNRYGPNSIDVVKKAFQKYDIPIGIRAAVINKLKGLVNQSTNNPPRSRPTQQPNVGSNNTPTGSAIQARYHNF